MSIELPDHYTARNDPVIDAAVEAHVARVAEEATRIVGDLRALFLVGAFARGEGGVVIEGHEIGPVNDYDFVVITESRRCWPLLQEIGERLAKELGVRAVDLIPLRLHELPGLPNTIFNHDLVTCGKLVVGEPSVSKLFPQLLPARIPISEGLVLLINRMVCLLESLHHRFLDKPPGGGEAFFCNQQGCKAVLACQDALLLMHRQYHHSYRERMLRLQEVPRLIEGLTSLSRQATAFKLRPGPVPGHEAVQMWLEGRRVLLAGLRLVMGEDSWERLERVYLRRWFKDLLRGRLLTLRRRHQARRRELVEMAELWVLVALDEDALDTKLEAASRRLFEAGFPVESPTHWETVRRRAVEAWFAVTH